jgi:large subunit ribosomal protein L17
MRHKRKGKKLGYNASHQKAMLTTMAAQLFEHQKITTTKARAKELSKLVDKMITLGKKGDVHARRQLLKLVTDRQLVHEIFEKASETYKERDGGYCRITKLGPRLGDAAEIAVIELV